MSHPAYRDAHRINQLLTEAAELMERYAAAYDGTEAAAALANAGFDPNDHRFDTPSYMHGVRDDIAGLAFIVGVFAERLEAVGYEPPAAAVGQKGGESL